MRYVSVGRRFLAVFIDGLIGLIWTAPFADIRTADGTFSFSLEGVPFLIVVALWVAYYTLMEGAFGASVGKMAVGIRVVRTDGGKIGWQAALVRNVLRIVDWFPWAIPYVVGAIMVWSSDTRQRLGDRVAKTVVIVAGSQAQQAVPGLAMPQAGGAPIPPPPPMPPAGA